MITMKAIHTSSEIVTTMTVELMIYAVTPCSLVSKYVGVRGTYASFESQSHGLP
jgi:hypothetical protein